MNRFYLGTHQPYWLWETTVPLFVSVRTSAKIVTLKPALCRYAIDSGGFTELSSYGAWRTPPEDYISECRRLRDECGVFDFAAPQDWMCEPFIVAKTGLSVEEHQKRTIKSFLSLRDAAPDIPFIPVLQGWTLEDYLRHIEDYDNVGVDLSKERTVGAGSVCRRQNTREAGVIFTAIAMFGIRIHGFGIKSGGIKSYGEKLDSADSMAWSFAARREAIRLPGCTHSNCANCIRFALKWREKLLE